MCRCVFTCLRVLKSKLVFFGDLGTLGRIDRPIPLNSLVVSSELLPVKFPVVVHRHHSISRV